MDGADPLHGTACPPHTPHVYVRIWPRRPTQRTAPLRRTVAGAWRRRVSDACSTRVRARACVCVCAFIAGGTPWGVLWGRTVTTHVHVEHI